MEKKDISQCLYLITLILVIISFFILLPQSNLYFSIYLILFLILEAIFIPGAIYQVKKGRIKDYFYGKATIAPALSFLMFWILPLLIPDLQEYISYNSLIDWIVFSIMILGGVISLIAWKLANPKKAKIGYKTL